MQHAKKILVVEDEQALREPLVKRLRGEGYAVDAAADGEEGAYCGNELPVDAAIVDLGLPLATMAERSAATPMSTTITLAPT